MEMIEGTIERVKFKAQDEESRFCILFVHTVGDKAFTVLGDMAEPMAEEHVKFWGEFSSHPKFGKQFKFTRFERVLPVKVDAIHHYIVKVAKWVGSKIADKIIEKYGEATLEVLKADPERVAKDIKGISIAHAKEISESLLSRVDEEKLMLEMGDLCAGCISDAVIKAAITEWKADAPARIKKDPYILTRIRGCGFDGADRVAKRLGVVADDKRRLSAALKYALTLEAARGGHTRVLSDTAEALSEQIAGYCLTNEAIKYALRTRGITLASNYYSIDKYFNAEGEIASHINRLMMTGVAHEHKPWNVEDCADDQKAAFEIAEKNGVSLLVGPPGTGKTYTLARIVEGYTQCGHRISLAAPTGKAAKKMTEALEETCGGYASTIHRLLEPAKIRDESGKGLSFQFSRNGGNPIEADILIIDETSMLDVNLAAQLLEAVPDGCRVIFVGDDNQLPSVGPGAVLRDLIQAGMPTARLTEIKRNKGMIVRACHAIKDGKTLKAKEEPLDLESGHNWRHIEIADSDSLAEQVVWLATEWAKRKEIDRTELMVISPFNHKNKRDLSCHDFNEKLQKALNPQAEFDNMPVAAGGIRIGDRVVRLSNGVADSEDIEGQVPIVNGDIGSVYNLDKKYIFVAFEAPDRRVKLARGTADLALAYALTCHKMQGSEARVIILPMHKSFGPFPSREWVYTAFSRAKEILLTVGTLDTLRVWAGRETNSSRQTWLQEMIKEYRGK